MKMKKIFAITVFSLFAIAGLMAQQQATYTQYMFNGMAINPGYIGTHDALSVTALGRWQWVGLEGAPNTQTIAIHSPVPRKNIGLGLQVTRDEIAVTNLTSVMAGYAYRIPVGAGILSMGLQAGLQSYSADFGSVFTIGNDPTFAENFSAMKPNVGAGLFYYNPIFYVGASAPLLINNTITNGATDVFTQRRHYFLTSGVMIPLSDAVKLKPNILARIVDGAPLTLDYNVNVLLNDILWLGVSFRPPESVNFLIEFEVTQQFRIGYALDYIIDETLSDVATTSHEFMLNYRFKLSRDKVVTPRYF